MQDAKETNLGPETLGIGGYFEQSGRAGLEEEAEQQFFVLPDEWNECVRHAEDQVKVVHGQQFLETPVEPFIASVALTLGAMSIATRVVGDGLMATTHALITMSAERGGAASRNSIEHLDLRPGQ